MTSVSGDTPEDVNALIDRLFTAWRARARTVMTGNTKVPRFHRSLGGWPAGKWQNWIRADISH